MNFNDVKELISIIDKSSFKTFELSIDNCQIVRLEPQRRKANEPSHRCRHGSRQNESRQHPDDKAKRSAAEYLRQGKFERAAAVQVVHAVPAGGGNGQNGVGVGPYQHESGLSQGEKPCKAIEQVHRGGHQRVYRTLFQYGKKGGVLNGVQGIFQHHRQDQKDGHAHKGDKGALFAFFLRYHSVHPLKPCP